MSRAMCTIIIARNGLAGYPLVVAHNRDELVARPWQPPSLIHAAPRVVAPRDALRDGTWLGLSEHGFVVAITNRMGAASREPGRSRGLLCRDALLASSFEAALEVVRVALTRDVYDGFNLLLADRRHGRVLAQESGAVHETELDDGVHVVTSMHHVDPPELQGLRDELAAVAARGAAPFEARLLDELRDHEPLPTNYATCKHMGPYGTVSSTVLWLPEGGSPRFMFAPNAPCRAPYAEVMTAPGFGA
jgi:uncharacterized protein with NRDE domain